MLHRHLEREIDRFEVKKKFLHPAHRHRGQQGLRFWYWVLHADLVDSFPDLRNPRPAAAGHHKENQPCHEVSSKMLSKRQREKLLVAVWVRPPECFRGSPTRNISARATPRSPGPSVRLQDDGLANLRLTPPAPCTIPGPATRARPCQSRHNNMHAHESSELGRPSWGPRVPMARKQA
jgi:hypothetical protein